jgi:hypothetical protein
MERVMKVQEVILRAMAKGNHVVASSGDHRHQRPADAALKGVFCALYSDRGSHFWLTPKVGGKVDPHRLTQVGRALRELDIQMIPAYSPQARGRSERNFGTWQG